MSYSEDTVISKLSTLNETQETIIGVSQWIMFHKRQAQQSARIWARYIGNAPVNRKLCLIYLANEIAQQSRAKKKDDFVRAFQEVIPSALSDAYHACPENVKTRIKRVVDVWKQRSIFSPDVIEEIEQSIESGPEMHQAMNGGIMGLLDDDTPSELKPLVSLHRKLNTHGLTQQAESAIKNYKNLFDSDVLPAPPLYAKKLAEIEKKLNEIKSKITIADSNREKYNQLLKTLLDESKKEGEETSILLIELDTKLAHVVDTKQEVEEMLVDEPQPAVGSEPVVEEPDPDTHEYHPEPIENSAVPAYSPLSSDDEDETEAPTTKKPKIDITSLEGLDPAVASLLSSLSK